MLMDRLWDIVLRCLAIILGILYMFFLLEQGCAWSWHSIVMYCGQSYANLIKMDQNGTCFPRRKRLHRQPGRWMFGRNVSDFRCTGNLLSRIPAMSSNAVVLSWNYMELMNYLWSIWILYGFYMELIGTPRLESYDSYDSYDLRDRNEEVSLVRSSAFRRDPELGADHIFVQHFFSIC